MQVYGGPFYVGIMSIKAVIMPLEKVKAFKEVFNLLDLVLHPTI